MKLLCNILQPFKRSSGVHLCSGAEGDWVNCGSCGEWAHFGCDQRSGLGAFKVLLYTEAMNYCYVLVLINVGA